MPLSGRSPGSLCVHGWLVHLTQEFESVTWPGREEGKCEPTVCEDNVEERWSDPGMPKLCINPFLRYEVERELGRGLGLQTASCNKHRDLSLDPQNPGKKSKVTGAPVTPAVGVGVGGDSTITEGHCLTEGLPALVNNNKRGGATPGRH